MNNLLKNEKEKTFNILFAQREQEICLSNEQKQKILGEKRVHLDEIIKKIDDDELKEKLEKHEEQNNILNAEYIRLFYLQGFKDALHQD